MMKFGWRKRAERRLADQRLESAEGTFRQTQAFVQGRKQGWREGMGQALAICRARGVEAWTSTPQLPGMAAIRYSTSRR